MTASSRSSADASLTALDTLIDRLTYIVRSFGQRSSDMCLIKSDRGVRCCYLEGHDGPCSWEDPESEPE